MKLLSLLLVFLVSCSVLKREQKGPPPKKYPVTIQGYGNKLFYETQKSKHPIQFSFTEIIHRILDQNKKAEDQLVIQQATRMSKEVSKVLWKIVECDLYKKTQGGLSFCDSQEAEELISASSKLDKLNFDNLVWAPLKPENFFAEFSGTLLKHRKHKDRSNRNLNIVFNSEFENLLTDLFKIKSIECSVTGVAFKTHKCFLK